MPITKSAVPNIARAHVAVLGREYITVDCDGSSAASTCFGEPVVPFVAANCLISTIQKPTFKSSPYGFGRERTIILLLRSG